LGYTDSKSTPGKNLHFLLFRQLVKIVEAFRKGYKRLNFIVTELQKEFRFLRMFAEMRFRDEM